MSWTRSSSSTHNSLKNLKINFDEISLIRASMRLRMEVLVANTCTNKGSLSQK